MSKQVIVELDTPLPFQQRLQMLEQQWGNPLDTHNPVGFQAVLKADEQDEMLLAGELLLDEYQLNAEFVPPAYGGRLTNIEQLIQIMRSVYRRDPCLGLGYGSSSLIAAVNVWATANPQQCHQLAELLLSNGKIACGYNELAHGSDLSKAACEAVQEGETLLLNGGKQIIANVKRANAILLYVRTSNAVGSRSHSLILINKADLPDNTVEYLPRFNSMGMRGVQLGGVQFKNVDIAAEPIVGVEGQALETAMKAFQITRIALPGMFIGIVDTGLRTVINYARQRKLYKKSVIDLPLTQSVLTNTFADLLLADSLSTIAARVLHILPRQSSIYAAVVKSLVPKILIQAMNQLSAILGAKFYLMDGEQAIFQKLLRDLKPASFGHAAKATCQMTLLPQLPLLARRSWFKDPLVPGALFDLSEALPELSFDKLSISANGEDPIMAALLQVHNTLSSHNNTAHEDIANLTTRFVEIWKTLQQQILALEPAELTVMASQHSYDLADHYACLVAASACLNLWWHNRKNSNVFLQKDDWILIVLHRIHHHLDKSSSPNLTPSAQQPVLDELMQRYDKHCSFDLRATTLSAWDVSECCPVT